MKFIIFFIAAMLGHALAASSGLRRRLANSASGSAATFMVTGVYTDSSCSSLYQQMTYYGGVCETDGTGSQIITYATSGTDITKKTDTWSANTACSPSATPTTPGTAAASGSKTTCTATGTGTYTSSSTPGSEPTQYGVVSTNYLDSTCSTSPVLRAVYTVTSGSCNNLGTTSSMFTVSGSTVTYQPYTSTGCTSSTAGTKTEITTGKCIGPDGNNQYSVYSITTAPSGPNLKLLALLVLLVIPIGLGVVWYLRRQGKCGGKAPEPVPTSEAEAAAKTTDNEVALVPTGESAEEPKA